MNTARNTLSTGATIGLGLAAVGRPAYITTTREDDLGDERSIEEMRLRTFDVLDAAYADGVRYLDCARSYGLSEQFLADWLRDHPEVDDVTVASKWGYRYVGEWEVDAEVHEVKDHSLGAFTDQWTASRSIIGDPLAIYQIHSLTPDSPALTNNALHRALARLRADGYTVGFSTSGPAQADVVRQAMSIEVDGEPLFGVVQSTWNPLETSVGPALAEAAEVGLSVVIKEGMANGRLAPGVEDESEARRVVDRVAHELDVSSDQVALAAALAQPWAAHVLSGAVTVEQVDSNVAAEELGLTSETVSELLAHPEPPAEYWAKRSQRSWS